MAIVVEHPLGTLTFPDGTTEEEINQSLVQLEAEYGEEYGLGETLGRSFERGISATARGIEQASGLNVPLVEQGTEQDLEREFQRRVMQEQSPVASFAGEVGGAILDPVTIPAKIAKVPATVIGLLSGGAYGFLEPTYEEMGDSVVANTLFGAGFGTLLGGGVDIAKRLINRSDVAEEVSEQAGEATSEAIENVQKAATKSELDDDVDVVTEAVEEVGEELPERPVQLTEVDEPSYVLPQILKGSAPKIMGSRVDFDNDIDLALYKIGANSKNKADLIDWTSRVLGVDANTVEAMAKRYRSDTINAGKKQAVDASVAKTKLGAINAPVSESYGALVQNARKEAEVVNEAERAQANFYEQLRRQQATKTVDAAEVGEQVRLAGTSPQSIGAAKTKPLDVPADVPEATVQRVMDEPETPTPKGQASVTLRKDLDSFVSKFIPALAKGRYTAKGRQARQGKGTQSAMERAGVKRVAQIAQRAGSAEEYFTALKAADAKNLDPEDIVASASVQQDIDAIITDSFEYYQKMVDEYGGVDKMPADVQRDIVESIMPALLTKQIISGSLTRASDMLNAQKLVNQIRRRERVVTELLGQRCY